MNEAVSITADRLSGLLAASCPGHGIDLAGIVALPVRLPHVEAWRSWLAAGRHAGLEYLARDPERRADPRHHVPWASSILVFAQRYTDGWPGDAEGDTAGGDWTDGLARYARGRDYHDVLLSAIRGVLADLETALPGLRAHPAVDTGPYLERELAWLAGLGFFGKNTCLIHERLGSGLVLGVAPANLELSGLPAGGEPAKEPLYALTDRRSAAAASGGPATRCGRCTRCLDACPTGALTAPFTLDANLCISTWTIEWQGRTPADRRLEQGGKLFGCDACQSVCPWNRSAFRRSERDADESGAAIPPPSGAYATDFAHAGLSLADLVRMMPDEFRRRFRRTPLWRTHPEGLRRNALVVAAGTARGDLVDVAADAAREDPDPEVRAVAAWAVDRLREDET